MDSRLIKAYCQFCLNLQTAESSRMPITRKIKQGFFDITQKKLNTTVFCEFICCEPCLEELESVQKFRTKLLANQKVLEQLNEERRLKYDQDEEIEQIIAEEIIVQEECIKTLENGQLIEDDMVVEYLEEEEQIEIIEEFDEEGRSEETLNMTENEIETVKESINEQANVKRKYQRKRLKTPIKCPKCDRQFFYKSYFTFHFKDVHQDQCEVCHHCGKVFKNSRRLNSHVLIHNIGEKRFKCDVCSKEFNYSGDLLRHKRIHENIKNYHCPVENCNKSFVQSYALKLHLDVHNNVRYACDNCGSKFSVKTTLKNHMLKCVNGIATYRTPRYRTKDSNQTKERYKCFIESCEREFSSRKYLGVHLEKNHQIKMENFENTCLQCQETFENIGDYAKHVKIHSCNFVCEMCKLRFKTEEKLQAHIKRLHKEGDDNRPFACNECGARFKRTEHLRGHQLYKHSDVKKFECSECPLKFRQRGEFNVHMRVHQNVTPFSCWKCAHVCKTSSNLRQHMRLVHDGETNIYCCDICQATFKYNVDLSHHKKDHSTIFEIVEINNVS